MKAAFIRFNGTAHLGLVVCAVVTVFVTARADAQENGKGYNAFRTVRTRNIFDPQRRAMRTESATTTTAVTATQRRPNFFALTGAMVTEDRALAFFSGSPSDYNKVLRAGEAIADYKITNVSAKGVELARDGKTISLNVGQQIPLDGAAPGVPTAMSSDFNPTSASGPGAVSSGSGSASTPGTPATVSGGGGGDKSEIYKRMMERREKEGSK
jgi:hypothetical protein